MTNKDAHLDDAHNRRIEDLRLLRMEEALNGITAKINNGLSSRSKETMATVKELVVKQNNLEREIHLQDAGSVVVKADICEIKDSLAIVIQAQQSWIKMINRGLLGSILIICSGVGWFFYHVDELDVIMDHINMDLASSNTLPNHAMEHLRHRQLSHPIELAPLPKIPKPEPKPQPGSAVLNHFHAIKPSDSED